MASPPEPCPRQRAVTSGKEHVDGRRLRRSNRSAGDGALTDVQQEHSDSRHRECLAGAPGRGNAELHSVMSFSTMTGDEDSYPPPRTASARFRVCADAVEGGQAGSRRRRHPHHVGAHIGCVAERAARSPNFSPAVCPELQRAGALGRLTVTGDRAAKQVKICDSALLPGPTARCSRRPGCPGRERLQPGGPGASVDLLPTAPDDERARPRIVLVRRFPSVGGRSAGARTGPPAGDAREGRLGDGSATCTTATTVPSRPIAVGAPVRRPVWHCAASTWRRRFRCAAVFGVCGQTNTPPDRRTPR